MCIEFCGLIFYVFDWQENLWWVYFYFHGHDLDYCIAKPNVKFLISIVPSSLSFSHVLQDPKIVIWTQD